MTADNHTETKRFDGELNERNRQIAQTLIDRADIDVEKYNDVTIEKIGRNLVTGGPMAHPAASAYEDLDGKIAKEEILPRIDEEIIAEHHENPIGQHSDDLERVLTYFRRQPLEDKYLLIETEKFEEWVIGKTTGVRGEPPEIVSQETYSSQKEADHALFLKRVEKLRNKFEE